MAFTDLVAAMDAVLLSPGQLQTLSFTLHYQSGSPDVVVAAITKNPAFEEDYTPGSAPATGQGVTNLFLFIRFTPLTIKPRRGDTATIGGVDYDIYQVDADREGGASLRLRRRTQAYTE